MFIRYAVAQFNRRQDELSYRYYFTELVRQYAQGKTFGESLYDMTHKAPEDTRTAEEIAAEVIASAGLEVIDNGAAEPPSEDNGQG